MHGPAQGTRDLRQGLWSCLVAAASLGRALPLLLAGRPRTPLRILCIAAFDTVHRLHHGQWLAPPVRRTLAVLLDFAAAVNATHDHKPGGGRDLRVTRRRLDEAGLGPVVAAYLERLGNLERGRPRPGGDMRRFQQVQSYREAVVRLSLGVVATAAGVSRDLDEAVEATRGDGDLNLLFRLVMQCQVIDDVLDFAQDRSAELPSFLTACRSLPEAVAATRGAVGGYADARRGRGARAFVPLAAALLLVSLGARVLLALRGSRVATEGHEPARKKTRGNRGGSSLLGPWQAGPVRNVGEP